MSLFGDIAGFASGLGDAGDDFVSGLSKVLGDRQLISGIAQAVPDILGASELNRGPYGQLNQTGQSLLNLYNSGQLDPADQQALNAFKASANAQAQQQMASMGLGTSTADATAHDTANMDASLLQSQMSQAYLGEALEALRGGASFLNSGAGLGAVGMAARGIGSIFGQPQGMLGRNPVAGQSQARAAPQLNQGPDANLDFGEGGYNLGPGASGDSLFANALGALNS